MTQKGPYSLSYDFSSNHVHESWTIKEADHWRIEAFKLWCDKEDSWESLGLEGDQTSQS